MLLSVNVLFCNELRVLGAGADGQDRKQGAESRSQTGRAITTRAREIHATRKPPIGGVARVIGRSAS